MGTIPNINQHQLITNVALMFYPFNTRTKGGDPQTKMGLFVSVSLCLCLCRSISPLSSVRV